VAPQKVRKNSSLPPKIFLLSFLWNPSLQLAPKKNCYFFSSLLPKYPPLWPQSTLCASAFFVKYVFYHTMSSQKSPELNFFLAKHSFGTAILWAKPGRKVRNKKAPKTLSSILEPCLLYWMLKEMPFSPSVPAKCVGYAQFLAFLRAQNLRMCLDLVAGTY